MMIYRNVKINPIAKYGKTKEKIEDMN